jgi:hypothetical protein
VNTQAMTIMLLIAHLCPHRPYCTTVLLNVPT